MVPRLGYGFERSPVIHVDKDGMIADIGTKVLAPRGFHGLRVFLVRSPHGNFAMIAK